MNWGHNIRMGRRYFDRDDCKNLIRKVPKKLLVLFKNILWICGLFFALPLEERNIFERTTCCVNLKITIMVDVLKKQVVYLHFFFFFFFWEATRNECWILWIIIYDKESSYTQNGEWNMKLNLLVIGIRLWSLCSLVE